MSEREPTDLEKLVKDLGVALDAVHLDLVTKDPDGKPAKWAHDAWRVTFTYGDKGRVISTSYKTGLGHRKPRAGVKAERGGFATRTDAPVKTERAAELGWIVPSAPTAADVLYCLVSDANGCDQSFDDWCADLGESNDSIKARDTYFACQKTRVDLISMFGLELFEKLGAAEH